MLTKSKIQLLKEHYAIANDYREGLENLMNKYLIEDSVFVYKNGMVYEATQGYFIKAAEYDSLMEAISNCNDSFEKNGIRITNNEKFMVGKIESQLSNCPTDSSIFDINHLTDIR